MGDLEQEQQLRESIEAVATRVAEHTVTRTLALLGVDATNPLRSQAEFQALRRVVKLLNDEGIVDDLAFLQRLRVASETARKVTLGTVVKALVTLLLALLAIGTKDWWMAHMR